MSILITTQSETFVVENNVSPKLSPKLLSVIGDFDPCYAEITNQIDDPDNYIIVRDFCWLYRIHQNKVNIDTVFRFYDKAKSLGYYPQWNQGETVISYCPLDGNKPEELITINQALERKISWERLSSYLPFVVSLEIR